MKAFTLLFNPDAFFDRAEYGFTYPTLILAGLAVCSLAIGGLRTMAIARALEGPRAETILAIRGIAVVVASVFTPLVLCLVYATAIYALARFYGGTGSFRTTFWSVAFGYLPGLVGSLLLVGATAIAVPDVPPPESVDALSAYGPRVSAHPVYETAQTLDLASIVWSGYLWVFATKHVHDLDELDALVSVGAPVLVTLLLIVLDLV